MKYLPPESRIAAGSTDVDVGGEVLSTDAADVGEVLPVGDPLADEQGGDEPDQPDVQPVPEPENA
jgi:hypothetical protein